MLIKSLIALNTVYCSSLGLQLLPLYVSRTQYTPENAAATRFNSAETAVGKLLWVKPQQLCLILHSYTEISRIFKIKLNPLPFWAKLFIALVMILYGNARETNT